MPRKRRQRSSWGSNEPAKRDGCRRLRYWADLHDGRGYCRRSMTIRGSKRDGDAKLSELWLRFGDGHAAVTVGEACESWWLPAIEDSVERGVLSKNSAKVYKSAWNKHVRQRWRDAFVGDIAHEEVQEWLLGLTPMLARTCRTVLRGVLEKCVARRVLERNVMKDDYEMPRVQGRGKRAPERPCLSLEGIRSAWKALWGSPCEAAFILCAFGSCRVGESLGVLAREVVFGTSLDGIPVVTCPISKQVDNRTGRVSDRLKNEWSYRSVVVAGPPAIRLRDLAAAAVEAGETWLCDDGIGAPLTQTMLRKMISQRMGDAGLNAFAPQILRPSWETSIARWTLHLDSEVIEKLMGHVGSGVTGRHYDRPGVAEFVGAVSSAYKVAPFADGWFTDGDELSWA